MISYDTEREISGAEVCSRKGRNDMAAMNRVYSLYSESNESALEKRFERGSILMPSCRRKATRNIVGGTKIHQE